MGPSLILTALTRDPETVRAADQAGVDRIGIDIERRGKHLRQGHQPDARVSPHELEDLATVAKNVTRAELFARLNPLYEGTRQEIDRALEFGARVLMLPYFTEPVEAARFIELVDGRARPALLLETAGAAARVREIAAIARGAEIMVGLNDLHLSLHLRSPFEVLLSDEMTEIARCVLDAGLTFGFGGLAQAGDAALPVPADLVYAQYPRLGATAAWLSRSFYRDLAPAAMPAAVRKLRERWTYWWGQPPEILETQRQRLAASLRAVRAAGC